MSLDRLSDLIDLAPVQKMADATYNTSGMPIGIIDAVDNSIIVSCGWQEICLKFHRTRNASLKRCQHSENRIKTHLTRGEACHYKCENGLWDIGIPIIVGDHHLATLFLGQFFYEGEIPDKNSFIRQAGAFEYQQETYLQALDKVPVFKKGIVDNIVKYNLALSDFIMDIAEAAIQRQKMDKTMQQAEERYHRLAENARDMLYRMSLPEGRYEYVSPASAELFGYEPKEFYDNPFLIKEILHPDWHDYFEKQWVNLIKGKAPPTYEYQIIHRDNSIRWINQRNTLELDEKGYPIAIEGVATDITERKNAEKALFESESHLRILVDTIPDLVWLKNPDGVYLSCNPTFERFFGAKEAEIIGKTDYDFVDKDLADFFREHDRNAMGLDTPSINEEWLTFSDDGYHGLFETIKTPMRDPNGKLIGVLGISRDISERKSAEKAMRLNEQRYKSAQKMGLVGNWEYDFIADTFWGSDQAKRIYGLEPDSNRFTTEEVENCIPERERVHKALMDLIEKNKPYNLEFEIHPISGPQSRIIRSVAELIRDDKGNPLKVVGVVQDVTEQKKSEIEKLKLEQQLTQAQKMEAIGRLAGGVAHDFNNMLSIILGNTEIVLEDLDISNPNVQNLIEVQKAAQRSTNLTRQLLAFARKQTISPEILDLNHTIEGMLKMLKRLIGENIHLAWRPEKSLWAVKIDPSQIDQILANLCVNARDAIKDVGKVTIETNNVFFDDEYCEEHNGFKPGEYTLIAFSDNGCGIDEETFQRLFEPFFTTKEVGKGTGLGLSTVYGIIKQNDGFINVYSEPGLGTTFKIYLPRHRQEPRIEGKPILKENLKGNETILLVEDEDAILSVTKLMLERLGYAVLATSKPTEAITICSTTDAKIDLLMTDVVMPTMNGRELSEKLSKIYPHMKSLYMSGYTANVIAHHGILDEGLNFINKPFSKQELSVKLRTILTN